MPLRIRLLSGTMEGIRHRALATAETLLPRLRKGEPIAEFSNQIGEFDSSAGSTYLDIASRALRMHKDARNDRADCVRSRGGRVSISSCVEQPVRTGQQPPSFGIRSVPDPSLPRLLLCAGTGTSCGPRCRAYSIVGIVCDVIDRTDSLLAGIPLSPLAGDDRPLEGGGIAVGCHHHGRQGWISASAIRPSSRNQRVACDLTVTSPRLAVSNVRWGFSVPEGWSIQEESGDAPLMSGRTSTNGSSPSPSEAMHS